MLGQAWEQAAFKVRMVERSRKGSFSFTVRSMIGQRVGKEKLRSKQQNIYMLLSPGPSGNYQEGVCAHKKKE